MARKSKSEEEKIEKDKHQGSRSESSASGKRSSKSQKVSKGSEAVKMLFAGISPDKEIKLIKPSDEDIINYSREIKLREDSNFSLNFFLQEKYDRQRNEKESGDSQNLQTRPDSSIGTPSGISNAGEDDHENDNDNTSDGGKEGGKKNKKKPKKIDYIKQIADSDKIIIADLRNIQISTNNDQEVLDLQGANFRGAYFDQTRFSHCDLKNATFADSNLKKVSIKYSDITHTDFRGCNLQNCVFGKEYAHDPYNIMKGVMFSMSSSELRIFADIKTAVAKKNEEQRLLGHKKLQLAEISQQTKLLTKILYFLGFDIEPGPYKSIKKEIAEMENGVFHKYYIVHETIKHLFGNDACSYYPIYKKFIRDVYEIKIKRYVKFSKKDLEEFLQVAISKNSDSAVEAGKDDISKNAPNQSKDSGKIGKGSIQDANKFDLSLNEFASKKYIESLEKKSAKLQKQSNDEDNNEDNNEGSNEGSDGDKGQGDNKELKQGGKQGEDNEQKIALLRNDDKKTITDLSSKVNKFGNNEWKRLKLAGMIFENLDMSYVNFAGSDLSGCKFSNVNLKGCNFDCCLLEGASFIDCDLSDASMINCDLSDANCSNTSLMRSNLNWVNAKNIRLFQCNLSYLSSEFGNWSKAIFDDVEIDGAIFTKAKLLKVRLTNSTLSNCILNFADFSFLQASGVSINTSLANHITLKDTVFDRCKFKNLESTKSNWTGAKIHEPSEFMECNFESSIFDGVKAASSKFMNCNFDEAKIGHGKLSDCDFKGSSFRFAEFNNSVFSQCDAAGSDFSGVSIFNTKMSDSIFSDAHFNGAKIVDSNLKNSKFDNAVCFNTYIKSSMMEKIDNHRIKINDVTEFTDCSMNSLEGQFYYYDEEGFMEVMFIEQQQAHQNLIQKLLTTRRWKILVPFLKIFSKEYNISIRERNKIILARRRNRNDLRMHYKHLKEKHANIVSEPILKIRNLIRSHNI